MGTPKRERQKANRQQRLAEDARAIRVGTLKRTVMRWVLGAVAALGGIVLIAWIGGAFSDDDEQAATDQPAVVPGLGAPPEVTIAPGSFTPADPSTGKPSVVLPTEVPTELVVTDVREGDGDAAEVGDTVLVHYVGIRSVDGVEFDNSYDRGTPFPVVLGSGGVIEGWDQGLVGVQTGGRRQLDIPAELAYGDQDRGTIRPGDALTFVIDIVSITPPAG